MIEIYLMTLLRPIPLAMMGNSEWQIPICPGFPNISYHGGNEHLRCAVRGIHPPPTMFLEQYGADIEGFPYTASFCPCGQARSFRPVCPLPGGIFQTWSMDITQLHGEQFPSVNVVTFGSPCRGQVDKLISLFMIINEMREATYGKYSRFVLFENMPYALQRIKQIPPEFCKSYLYLFLQNLFCLIFLCTGKTVFFQKN